MTNEQRRYPGAKPFEEHQSHIFYGRDEASKSLYRLIKQEDLVVLHAKSGIGKSSLVKAGVLPLVRKEGVLFPLEVRLGASGSAGQQPPVERTAEAIEKANTNASAADFIDQLLPEDNSLWRKLKQLQISQLLELEETDTAPEILLIFDQFEELFTYSGPEKLQFRQELAEALYTPLPQRYWDMLGLYDGYQSPITPKQRQLLLEPLNLHVLTAIREDRIHLLGVMADYLPMISKNWFVLEHLNEAEAIAAIELPASLQGAFATVPFSFAPATRDAIIDYLSTDKAGGIESTQLQVICDAIDRRTATDTDRLITPKRVGDLRQITEQYYWDKLADIEDEDQRQLARLLIEDQLIYEQAERRLSLFSGQITDHGLRTETLKLLVDGYLLRAEPDLRGGYNYELSHDSLVTPILKAKRERVVEEEKVKALVLAKKQEAILAEEKDKSRRARRLNSILFGLLALAVVAIGVSVYFYLDAREKERIAIDKIEEAADASLRAEDASLKAKDAAKAAADASLKAEDASTKAKDAAQKAEAVLDKIYFYAGEYGLATNGSSYRPKYGFINKQLETKIDFIYEQAQAFDGDGFAKVSREGQSYMIDTTGQEYVYTTSLAEVTEETTLLDLRGQSIAEIPTLATENSQIEVVLAGGIRELYRIDGLTQVTKLKLLSIGGSSFEKFKVYDISPLAGLTNLTSLDLGATAVYDISPLVGLTKLTFLNLEDTAVKDISPLAGLSDLTILGLNGTEVKDIGPLAGLTNLTTLDLTVTKVEDVSPLAGLTNLAALDLSVTKVNNVSPLAGLTNLTALDLGRTAVKDVSPLAELTNLTILGLYVTAVKDISPLVSLMNLTKLGLNGTAVKDISPLVSLTNLTYLDLEDTAVKDISSLVGLTNLTYLDLEDTAVKDISPLAGLTNLTELDLRGTAVKDVSPLAWLTNLTELYLSGTNVSDISPLAGLTNLTELYLSGTNVSDISPLADLTNLTYLNLDDTAIKDISPLAGLTNLTQLNLSTTPNISLSQIKILQAALPKTRIPHDKEE